VNWTGEIQVESYISTRNSCGCITPWSSCIVGSRESFLHLRDSTLVRIFTCARRRVQGTYSLFNGRDWVKPLDKSGEIGARPRGATGDLPDIGAP